MNCFRGLLIWAVLILNLRIGLEGFFHYFSVLTFWTKNTHNLKLIFFVVVFITCHRVTSSAHKKLPSILSSFFTPIWRTPHARIILKRSGLIFEKKKKCATFCFFFKHQNLPFFSLRRDTKIYTLFSYWKVSNFIFRKHDISWYVYKHRNMHWIKTILELHSAATDWEKSYLVSYGHTLPKFLNGLFLQNFFF